MERILTGSPPDACEIVIGEGIAAAAEELLPPGPQRRRVALLSQPGSAAVADAVASSVGTAGVAVAEYRLPDREAAKTLAVAEDVYLWLNSLGMTRGDTLVAVGGGAATDVGGFVGATYLRGIETVLVPTTLLGAVDAAIGGKTGVNVGGKNLAGVFREPARVLIDTSVLARLPADLIVEGTAEAVKAGLIADPELVDIYRRCGREAPLNEVVVRAVRVKAAVVGADLTEQGTRAILNYGHTVGHAVEYLAGIPHGHAVAIGMVAAGAAAELVTGFAEAPLQRQLLADLGLPIRAPALDVPQVEELMELDKKRDAAGLRMVLLEEIGKPTVRSVDPTTVRAALRAVGIE